MISAVLVDDMRPALRELEFLLQKYPDIIVSGMYTDPITAIEKIGALRPQVVFLDIHMPQLQGIDAASKILDISPGTNIVFVTAFDQYAVEAFELHAMDYLLKPIDEKRLAKTVARLRKKAASKAEPQVAKLKIRCFGRFQVRWDGWEPIKWRTEKTKEIFAYLLHCRERDLTKDELLDQLWPENDPQKSIRQLYNGIYHIRKALQDYGIDRSLISIDSRYNLKLGQVDLDVGHYHDFEQGRIAENTAQLEALEALYQGDYLESEYYAWADLEMTRLENLYQQCLLKLARLYLEQRQFAEAERKLLQAYRKNPYEESITELMLTLYRETGEKTKAVSHFKAYTKLLKEELGLNPGQVLNTLHQSIITGSDSKMTGGRGT